MNDILVYHPYVGPVAQYLDEELAVSIVTEEPDPVSFASLNDEPEVDEVDDAAATLSPTVTGLPSDVLELGRSSPVEVALAPVSGPSSLHLEALIFTHADPTTVPWSPLRANASAFIPRATAEVSANTSVSARGHSEQDPPSPLRKDAPEFKPRNALSLSFESRQPSNVVSSRDALTLACAAQVGLVTPRHVLRLEAPKRRKKKASASNHGAI